MLQKSFSKASVSDTVKDRAPNTARMPKIRQITSNIMAIV